MLSRLIPCSLYCVSTLARFVIAFFFQKFALEEYDDTAAEKFIARFLRCSSNTLVPLLRFFGDVTYPENIFIG